MEPVRLNYAQNAAALDEIERLDPHIMAQVDPQGFWGAVLHIDTCLAAIRALGDTSLIVKWEGIREGTITNITHNDYWWWRTP